MSNTAGNHFDNQIILYFFLATAIIYVSIYLTITYLGYDISDIPPNGNILTPALTNILDVPVTFLNWLVNSDFVTWLSSFSLFDISPFGLLSGVISAFADLIDQFIIFISVWNVLNIYIFYILFIPYTIITSLIIFDLVVRLIEGLIP